MNTKTIKVPGPDHPISIAPAKRRIVVRIEGKILADSLDALTLSEASYPPVWYLPRKDADLSLLVRSTHSTYCPYKGECTYFSIPLGAEKSINAVWTYENPYDSVAAIRGHLAFYRDRVESILEA